LASQAQRHQSASHSFDHLASTIEGVLKLVSEEAGAELHEKAAHLDSMNSIAMRLSKIETAAKSITKIATRDIKGKAKDMAKDAANEAAERAKDAANKAVERAKGAANEAAEKAKDAANEAAEKAKDSANEAAERAKNEAVERAKDAASGAAQKKDATSGATLSKEAAGNSMISGLIEWAGREDSQPANSNDEDSPPQSGEEANLHLQLILRTSIERRYAHDWVGTQLHTISKWLQIVALVGGTIAYLCLFFSLSGDLGTSDTTNLTSTTASGDEGEGFASCDGDDEGDVRCVLRQIGEALTIGLTVIGYIRVMGAFDSKAAKHDTWRGKFASIARDAAMLLTIDDLDEQLCEVPKLRQRIKDINAPKLPTFLVKRMKAKKGGEEGLKPGSLIYPVLSGEETLTGEPTPEPESEEKEHAEDVAASWDDATRKGLKQLKLDASVREIAGRFNATFENMPDLPEPMPKRYEHISMSVNLEKARKLAPLTEVTYPKTSKGERLRRGGGAALLSVLVGMYSRALELSYAHQGQAWQHKASLAKVQTSTIFVAGLISITLLLAAPLLVASIKGYVDIAASILAACLSLANAWIKFARYEQLEAEHAISCAHFADLYFDIDALFAELSVLAVKAPLLQLLDWAAEQEQKELLSLAEAEPASSPPSPPPSPPATNEGQHGQSASPW
jgi:hypothetical protein